MSKEVKKEEVAERLHRHVLDNYTLLADVSKGIALAIGSAALLTILVNSEWMRLLPWLGSIAAVIISYVKWNRGAILSNARASTWDAVFPMLMGVEEFLLFAILAVDKQQNLPPNLWLNWPVLIALHAFTAAGLVSNRICLTDVSRDFDASEDPKKNMSSLGWQYVKWMKNDRSETIFIGTIALVIWAVGHCWILQTPDGTRRWAWVVNASALVFFVVAWMKPIPDANRERNEIETFVSK